MELERLKRLEIKIGSPVEYTAQDERYSRATRLGYYQGLTESLPEEYKEGKPEPPFVTIAHAKDKNGCETEFEDISLVDLLDITSPFKADSQA